jgi:hypothetical protein
VFAVSRWAIHGPKGPEMLSFPELILIAISQRLATLRKQSLVLQRHLSDTLSHQEVAYVQTAST